MKLKKLRLGVNFVMESDPTNPLDADSASVKAMREAAKQLGLAFETEDY